MLSDNIFGEKRKVIKAKTGAHTTVASPESKNLKIEEGKKNKINFIKNNNLVLSFQENQSDPL